MSIAAITRTNYVNPHTITGFLTALTSAMTTAGFTLYDSKVIGGEENRIYSIQLSNFSKGTVYLRVSVSNVFVVAARLSSAWNINTSTATSESINNNVTAFSTTSLVSFGLTAISSDELKGVLITQGANSFLCGIVRPVNKEPWYDENLWNYALLADNLTNSLYTTRLNPGVQSNPCISNQSTSLSLPNPYNNNKRQTKIIEFYLPNTVGVFASTSADLVICASSGISGTGIDELITDTATYLYLGKSTQAAYGLAVRIA